MEQDEIDKLNKEAIDILGYEKAPINFTSQVMDRILHETVQGTKKDNPIISLLGWLVIFIFCLLLFVGFWLMPSTQVPGKDLLTDSFINDWWTQYVKPFLNALLNSATQIKLIMLIGLAATFMLLADRFIGNKLAASKTS